MAEYIDRNLIEWYGCNFENASCENRECSGCSHAECSHSQVMQIPTADVIEQAEYDKIVQAFKALVEMKNENLIDMWNKYYAQEKKYAELHKEYLKAIHNHTECLKELHKYRSKIGKAIDKIKGLSVHANKIQVLKILQECIGE